jgi:hypothetical protein
MPPDLMTQCEQKKQFRLTKGEAEWLWVKLPVSLVGTSYEAIRCMHCHGAVRIHRRNIDGDLIDHVVHISRQDSEDCPGGSIYVQGEHRLSLRPVR